jgi:hypothetical protein
MPVPACGNGRTCERASSEAEANPRARRSPLEGGVNPRARRNLLEGAFEWATPVGCGGPPQCGPCPCARLNERCIVLLFAGFKQDSPSCFRGPSGLSPTHPDKFHDFWTSFGFYIIYKYFSRELLVMIRQQDAQNFM